MCCPLLDPTVQRARSVKFSQAKSTHASLGRFLTRDPIGVAGGLNLYAYAGSNPATVADPRGLQPPSPSVAPSPRPFGVDILVGPGDTGNQRQWESLYQSNGVPFPNYGATKEDFGKMCGNSNPVLAIISHQPYGSQNPQMRFAYGHGLGQMGYVYLHTSAMKASAYAGNKKILFLGGCNTVTHDVDVPGSQFTVVGFGAKFPYGAVGQFLPAFLGGLANGMTISQAREAAIDQVKPVLLQNDIIQNLHIQGDLNARFP